jgi:hypothetical protein
MSESESSSPPPPPPSFTGYWRVDHSKSEGMDPILSLMGVPWLVRRVADQLDVATVIAHDSSSGIVSTSEKTSVGVVSENKMVANGVFVEKKGSDGRFAKVRCTVSLPNELLRDVTERKEQKLTSKKSTTEGETQKEGKEDDKSTVTSDVVDDKDNGFLGGAAEPGAFTLEECLEFCANNAAEILTGASSSSSSSVAEGIMRIVTILPDNLGITDNAWVLLRGRARMIQRLAFSRNGQTVRIRRELFNTEAPDAEELADIVAKEKTASARKKGKNESSASRRSSLLVDENQIDKTGNDVAGGDQAVGEELNEEAHALREAQSAYSLLVGGSAPVSKSLLVGEGGGGVFGNGGGGREGVVDVGVALLRAAIGLYGGSVIWSEPDRSSSSSSSSSVVDPFFVSLSGVWVTQSNDLVNNIGNNPSATPPLTPAATPSSSRKLTTSVTASTNTVKASRLSTLRNLWKANVASKLVPTSLTELLEAASMSIEHNHELCVLSSVPSTSSSSSSSSPSSLLTPRIVLPLDGQWRPERIVKGEHHRWVLIRATHLNGSGDRGPAWVGHEFQAKVNGMVPRVFLSGDEGDDDDDVNHDNDKEKKKGGEKNHVSSSSSSEMNPMTADPYLPFFSCLDFDSSLYSSSEVLIEVILEDIGHQVQEAAVNFAKRSSIRLPQSSGAVGGGGGGRNLKFPAVAAATAAGLEPWQALPWTGTVPLSASRLQLRFKFNSSSSSSSNQGSGKAALSSTSNSNTAISAVNLIESITFVPSTSSSSSSFSSSILESKITDAEEISLRSATFNMALSSPGLQSVRALEEKKRIQHVRAKLLTRRADADRLRKTYFISKIVDSN